MIACVIVPDLVTLIEGDTATSVILVNPAGKVQAASTSAIQSGVRTHMGAQQAATLCSGVQLHSFNETLYIQITDAIHDALETFTTRIELLPGFWQHKQSALCVPWAFSLFTADFDFVQSWHHLGKGCRTATFSGCLQVAFRFGNQLS